jgi:HSP20 family protein
MAITLWRTRSPFEGLTTLFDDFESIYDDFFVTPAYSGIWTPAVDIEEKDGMYLLRADLPGMEKKDIHIELKDGCLTLKGVRESKVEEKEGNYRKIERSYGCFERSFRVPEGVTEKDIKAKYHDGVLELSIPAPKVEKPKAIEVKVE